MMPEPLTLVCPSAGPRLRDVIETALCDLDEAMNGGETA